VVEPSLSAYPEAYISAKSGSGFFSAYCLCIGFLVQSS
jgi:hypothetical protein